MKRLLGAAGTIAVAASLLPLAARAAWIFELVTHFRLQIVAALAALLLVFLARRAYAWCLVLLACAALNMPPLVAYLRPAVAHAAGSATVSFLAVNVAARNDEYAGLLETIARANADVVVLVEFTRRWSERIAVLSKDYPHQARFPRDDAFGIALLSRYPFETADEVALGPSSAIDARLQTPRGIVRVIGVHLYPPVSAARARLRNGQLEALAELLAPLPDPLVVLGDFNVSPYSPYLAAWLARTGLRDARRGFGLDFTWPAHFPPLGVPIDHILVSASLGVAEHRRLPAFGSDHYPVLARLVQDHAT